MFHFVYVCFKNQYMSSGKNVKVVTESSSLCKRDSHDDSELLLSDNSLDSSPYHNLSTSTAAAATATGGRDKQYATLPTDYIENPQSHRL